MIRPVLLMVTVLLSSCGFQLRGEAELPASMGRTFIAAPRPNDQLPRQLALLLKGSDVEVVDQRQAATAVLVIDQDQIVRSIQSVGATARVREFVLNYTVRFHLEDGEGGVLVQEQTMELSDDYQFDQQQVLGTTSEEELLRQEMVRTMARHILRRLEFAARP